MFTRDDLNMLLDPLALDGIHPLTASFYTSSLANELQSFTISVDGYGVKESLIKLSSDIAIRKSLKEQSVGPFRRLYNRIVFGIASESSISVHKVYDQVRVSGGTIFDRYEDIRALGREDRFLTNLSLRNNDHRIIQTGFTSEIELLINMLLLLFEDKIKAEDNIHSIISMIVRSQSRDGKNHGGMELDLAKMVPMSPIVSRMSKTFEQSIKESVDMSLEETMPAVLKLSDRSLDDLERLALIENLDIPLVAFMGHSKAASRNPWEVVYEYDNLRPSILAYGSGIVSEFIVTFGSTTFVDCAQSLLENGLDRENIMSLVEGGSKGMVTAEQICGVAGSKMPKSWLMTYLGI